MLYLLPVPFNILYIAPVFYDREDCRTITEGERYFSAGSLAELPPFFFSTFWVLLRGKWNISSWRNRCNKSEIAVECPLNVDCDWNPGDTHGCGSQSHFWKIAAGGKISSGKIRLEIILPLERVQLKLILPVESFVGKQSYSVYNNRKSDSYSMKWGHEKRRKHMMSCF